MSLIEIHLEIIRKCFLGCIHCSASNPREEEALRFEYKHLQSLFDNCDPDLRFVFCLTGGEPLICPDLLTWIRQIRDSGRADRIGLFTSGLVLMGKDESPKPVSEELANQLRDEGADFSYVSLYSKWPRVHDEITKVQGSHKATLDTIRNLTKVGIEVRVHYVPMKHTIDDLPIFVTFLEDNGIAEMRFLKLVYHGSAVTTWDRIGLSIKEQRSKITDLLRRRENSDSPFRITVAGFPDLIDCRPFPTGAGCQAGKGLLYIDWKGDVYPCACTKNRREQVKFNLLTPSTFTKWQPDLSSDQLHCLNELL